MEIVLKKLDIKNPPRSLTGKSVSQIRYGARMAYLDDRNARSAQLNTFAAALEKAGKAYA